MRVLRDAFTPGRTRAPATNSSAASTPTGLPSTSRYATCSRPKWRASAPLSPMHCTGCTANWSRSAPQEPVAFLAQLGRDHRKHGVLPSHYDTLRRALYATLRSHLGEAWTDAVDDAADQSLNLITGVMSGAADADEGPAWWDGTVIEHIRVSRDLAVVRLRLDRPMHYHPGQYVNVHVPQCPRRWRYLSAPPFRLTRTAESSFTSAWSPAAWSAPPSSTKPNPATGGGYPARMAPAGRPRRRGRADGGR